MKVVILFTASAILFQNVSCDAFQQQRIRVVVAPLRHGLPRSIPNVSFVNAHDQRNAVGIKNNHIAFRGGSRASNMMDPNIIETVSFNNGPLQLSSIIFSAINLLGFFISLFTGSHIHLDLLGSGAFAAASLPTLLSSSSPTRVMVSSGAVALWGTKLASFLFFRALKVKTDVRLEDTLGTVSGTATFWFISLFWGLICSLPHTLGTTSSLKGNPITLCLGFVLYLLGLATETKADYQKWMFKQSNPGKFCNEGLWSISQHPNFFGNLLLWLGIFVMNADSLIEPVKENGGFFSTLLGSWRVWVALLSPAFIWSLFQGQATGSVTNSLELANQKYGSDATYNAYIKNVPLIVPRILDWLKQLFS